MGIPILDQYLKQNIWVLLFEVKKVPLILQPYYQYVLKLIMSPLIQLRWLHACTKMHPFQIQQQNTKTRHISLCAQII